MGRTVISKQDLEKVKNIQTDVLGGDVKTLGFKSKVDVPVEPDKYMLRLLKYIPTEIIALYVTLEAIVHSLTPVDLGLYWIIFIFCFAATPLYLWRKEKVYKILQLTISTIAFLVWVFTMGGPFISLGWYRSIYGALGLPVYTFLVALIEA